MIKLESHNGWVTKDKNGFLYPWYTSGALDFIDKIDFNGKRVFEYGVGNSTLWYRSRGAVVEGVDSNKDWLDFAGLSDCEPDKDKYIRAINKYPKFDLIIIDGDFRDQCTYYALKRLNTLGMIIIDNWMQPSVEPNEWHYTLDMIAIHKLKFEVYRQEGHSDWGTLIIFT